MELLSSTVFFITIASQGSFVLFVVWVDRYYEHGREAIREAIDGINYGEIGIRETMRDHLSLKVDFHNRRQHAFVS